MSTEQQHALEFGLPVVLSEAEVWSSKSDTRVVSALSTDNYVAQDDDGDESHGPPAAATRSGMSPMARLKQM